MFKKLFFSILCLPTIVVAQHKIKGNFLPVEDFKWAVLYKVTPIKSLYIANTEIDKNGDFEFQLDSKVTQGMYKIVYALPQEENNFDIIYNAKEDVKFKFNKETGIKYLSSIENQLVYSYTNSMSLVSQSIGNFFQQQSKDTLALVSIFKTQRETQSNFEEAAKGTIALHFIKANKPYIPKEYEDIKTYISNLKVHFFDSVDFNNETLQSSNFLVERMLNYVFGMFTKAENETIAYEKNIDDVIVAMKAAQPEIKKTLLEVLWQQMVDANFENVANYISDNYLIKLAESLSDTELVVGLKLFKSLSIGKTAPDFSWEVNEGTIKTTQQLSSLKTAENYILVFWSSTCSHCLEEVPELQAYLKTLETGKFQVVAVGLEDDSVHWENEILKYPEFIHVLGLGKWQNKIGKRYNVSATPTYYILDKDKKIIGKPNDFEALKKFFKN